MKAPKLFLFGAGAAIAACAACAANSGSTGSAYSAGSTGSGNGGSPSSANGFGVGSGTPTATTGAGGTCSPQGTPLAQPIPCANVGITLNPPYATDYKCFDLGTIPSIPKKWGGLTIQSTKPNTLILGAHANNTSDISGSSSGIGALYTIDIVRDTSCHVVGFSGTGTMLMTADSIDGGLAFGPNDILFMSAWNMNTYANANKIRQANLATQAAKTIDTAALGVVPSAGGFAFVPEGFAGAGMLKIANYPLANGFAAPPKAEWATLTVSNDGTTGLYSLGAIKHGPTLAGGSEGIVFVKGGNPDFAKNSVLINDWDNGNVSAYELDATSDPVLSTKKPFLTGFDGSEGAMLDPTSGDFLFSTFNKTADKPDHIIAVHGFAPPPPVPPPPM